MDFQRSGDFENDLKRVKVKSALFLVPYEALWHMLTFVDVPSVMRVSITCSFLRRLICIPYKMIKDGNREISILDSSVSDFGGKLWMWYCLYKRLFRSFVEPVVVLPDLVSQVCSFVHYDTTVDYQILTKNLVIEMSNKEKESMRGFVDKSSSRRQCSTSDRTVRRKTKELKELMTKCATTLSRWCEKNHFHNCLFRFEVEFSFLQGDDSSVRYGGEVSLSKNGLEKGLEDVVLVKECEYRKPSISASLAAEAVIETGMSEKNYSYLRNKVLGGESGLPSFYQVEKEIQKAKDQIYEDSKVILNKDNKPIGVLTPILALLARDYNDPSVLCDLVVRNHYFSEIYKEEERNYRKYRSEIVRKHNVMVEKLKKRRIQIVEKMKRYVISKDVINVSEGDRMEDEEDENEIFKDELSRDVQIQKDKSVIEEIDREIWELNGCMNKMRDCLHPKRRSGKLEEEVREWERKALSKKSGKSVIIDRKIEDLKKMITFWKVEQDYPEKFGKFKLSKKFYVNSKQDDFGNVYLSLGNVIRRGDDGHPIFKGGFSLYNFNENVSAYMFPSASFPNRLENHSIVSQVLSPENRETYDTLLQAVSDDTDQMNGMEMTQTFYVPLDYKLNDEKGTSLYNFLVEERILTKKLLKPYLKDGKIPVRVTTYCVYSADWKSLFLAFSNTVKGLFSPCSTQLKDERIVQDLQTWDKIPLVSSIFNYPTSLCQVLLRSSKNLLYMKTIPTIARKADISLHGDVRMTNSALFQGLVLAGLENIGLKAKALQVFRKFGLVGDSVSSVTRKNPLSLSHIKVGSFHKNRESVLSKLQQLYDDRKGEFTKKLEIAEMELSEKKFKSEKSKEIVLKKVEKLKEKIKACNCLIDHHSHYLKDIFELLGILNLGNDVEKHENYRPHSKRWIRKEFLGFSTIKDTILPKLTRIQSKLKDITTSTGVCGYYFNHLVREFILYLTTFFNSRDNQTTMERLGYLLNRAYRNSSLFGGRERKQKREMSRADGSGKIAVNRKIDTIIGTKARLLIRQKSKRREFCKLNNVR